jgi:DNA-binding MarR family transcriptional regulator
LVKLGLVDRVADPQDARRVHLKLTRKGERKLRALSQKNLEELRRAASPALDRLLRSFRKSGGPNPAR